MKTVIIIPTRIDSNRLFDKPMRKINGKSIIAHCFHSAYMAKTDNIYVASSDKAISREILNLDGNMIITSNKPVNGTERVAEAARILKLASDDIIVNLQGDMPFFTPEIIDDPVEKIKAIPECNIASAMTFLEKGDEDNLNRVKVTVDGQGKAIDFDRKYGTFLHIGVYVFRNSFLQKYAEYGVTEIEVEEHLEQKRLDFMNEYIWMAFVENRPVVIDTEEDLKNARIRE